MIVKQNVLGGTTREELVVAFGSLDEDRTGFIGLMNLKKKVAESGRLIENDYLRRCMAWADKDGDGVLIQSEFSRAAGFLQRKRFAKNDLRKIRAKFTKEKAVSSVLVKQHIGDELWVSKIDQKSGNRYYYTASAKKAQWKTPEGWQVIADTPGVGHAAAAKSSICSE